MRPASVLVYGGSFDPPHRGHMALLSAAIASVEPQLTLVIPSKTSPHKRSSTTPFFHRLRMSRCFLSCGGKIKLSPLEFFRRGKSYTLDTLKQLQQRWPAARLYLLVGSDMLLSFEQWHCYEQILSACVLVAGCRRGEDTAAARNKAAELTAAGGNVVLLENVPLAVSSTELRACFSAGNTSALVTPEVAKYIRKHRLYRKNGQ